MTFLSDAHILSIVLPTNPSLGQTSGTITALLDTNKIFQKFTQTGNITFVLAGSGNNVGISVVYHISGDSTSTISFPSGWLNVNGNAFDNTKENFIYVSLVNATVNYAVLNTKIVDNVSPAYNVQNISNISNTSCKFNVQINKAGYVKYIVTSSSTVPSKADIIAGTGAIAGNYGNQTMVANTTSVINLTGLISANVYYVYSYAINANGDETAVQSYLTFTTSATAAIVFEDTFAGSDITDIVGRTPTTGAGTWKVISVAGGGGTMGIVSNKLKNTSSPATNLNQLYGYDIGKTSFDATIIIGAGGGNDLSSIQYAILSSATRMAIMPSMKIIDATNTVVFTGVGSNWVAGDVIRIVFNTISGTILYKNGAQVYNGTAGASATGTNIGFYIYQDNVVSFSKITVY